MMSEVRNEGGIGCSVVWIVTEDYGQDAGVGIRGVFATKKLADAHIASIGLRKRHGFDIEAHDVLIES